MSTDDVNYALTKVTRRIVHQAQSYSVDTYCRLLDMTDVLRACLIRQDVAGFDRYINGRLAEEPDAAVLLLVELFVELGCKDRFDLDERLAA